jgi:hypothetical protein
MIIKKKSLHIILGLLILYLSSGVQLCSQKKSISGQKPVSYESMVRQDTSTAIKKPTAMPVAGPDTNFTWEKYASFLGKISDTSKYIVLPLNEFRKTFRPGKVVIGLRHDVDVDLNVAYQFSEIESKLGFRSTYFILHTAPYYLADPGNMAVHSPAILPILKTMQNDRKFEIGWHNDLVTLQAVYNIDPVAFLHNELRWLRENGINIYGTASHGSNYCYVYKYVNYYFFEECTYPVVGQFVNNLTLPLKGKNVPMKKGKLSDFNLEYEAYFLNNNKVFSDATVNNGVRWNIGMLDLSQLNPGDRVIILLHPIHWHKASVNANMDSFFIKGQKFSTIDPVNSTITVVMPSKTDPMSLVATFALSPGAYAKVSGNLQHSGISINNYRKPLRYVVYAENRDIRKEWLVKIQYSKNDSCNFTTFSIPGMTKSVVISPVNKTIKITIPENADLAHLPVHFELSAGATAWIGSQKQSRNSRSRNFVNSVEYNVIAEDGVTNCLWVVTVKKTKN